MIIIPVILAGGTGSRLWPLSRVHHPKQFHELTGKDPLLIETARRVCGRPGFMPPIIITNEHNRFFVAAAFKNAGLAYQSIVLEPEGRSTAPATAVAAHMATSQGRSEAALLIMPADHYVADTEKFLKTIETGFGTAQAGHLVTFGIRPSKPETGYGYIKTGAELNKDIYEVLKFIEKPNGEDAKAFCASKQYLWNAGIFLFKPDVFLYELSRFEPEMVEKTRQAVTDAVIDLDFFRLGAAFRDCKTDSIDYAVMEKTDNTAVVPFNAGWSDVGTWDALYDIAEKDAEGNATRGDVYIQKSQRCYVRAENGIVAVSGVDDVIVIATKDATLITKRGESGSVREIVHHLSSTQRNEAQHHLKVHRPWGAYETLHLSERYQVKQIVVEPGGTLSLQRHHHRAEHWIVVKGTARVTVDGDVRLLTENQSTYIPLGAVHRLENPGLIPLCLIEVQSGSYLGEDDIERLEDVYSRS